MAQWEWGWRPSKIEWFLVWMSKVLWDWLNSIILTDEELFLLANEELEEKDRICYATFKVYKASKNKEEAEWYTKFLALYKKALTEQKKNLFQKLEWNEWQWQKYAWIIERKFDDWNLRIKSENTNKNFDLNVEKEDIEGFKDLLKDNNLM